MDNKKRVITLYRVSTIGQVDKNDIPMQKQCCREFIDCRSDWELVKEVFEKGVSGYKKSAKDRDAIQEIQQYAIEKKFDVLLVYMFDRLGRRDDETPFIVEWFVQQGIEVWSVMEGQQRFDNHVDKLLNYIRYWQASGESIKTSIRVKTRLEQLTEKGLYTGGSVPYGYRIEKMGRTNKRNKEVYDLLIDEDAAQIVRLIFYKYVNEGFGAQRISRYLMEMNIRKADGNDFPNTSIISMLKRRIYTGVITNGDAESAFIPELQIIDQATFDRAQELMKARTQKRNEVPLNLAGQSLLVGNVYCGHCRNRLTLTTSGRQRVNKDGSVHSEVRARYGCHYKVRHPDKCNGQSGYGVPKLDAIMDEVIRYQLGRIKMSSESRVIADQHEKAIELARARLKIAEMQLAEKAKELSDYQAETIRVIRGESRLSADLLSELVDKTKGEITELSAAVEAARRELNERMSSAQQEQQEFEKLQSWADLYDNCTFAAKKMIVSQFIEAVYVYRDYTIEVEFNVSFDEFKDLSANCTNEGNEKATVYPVCKEKDRSAF
mgnify:CR=1 FL=1